MADLAPTSPNGGPYLGGAQAMQPKGDEADPDYPRLLEHIMQYDKEFGAWEKRADKVVERYADERNTKTTKKRRYNVLWSNVQTLRPALYFSPPKPNIERRDKVRDPVGLIASEILEQATTYFTRETQFHDNAKNAVLDRLLPGRGTLWVRYVPHFKDSGFTDNPAEGPEVSDEATGEPGEAAPTDAQDGADDLDAMAAAEPELEFEECAVDYVHWRDFGHEIARTWSEVTVLWRRVYLDKRELKARFPNKWQNIPLDHNPHAEDREAKTYAAAGKKATIYEMWDKSRRMVYWLHKDVGTLLDSKPDFLEVKDFWPCEKPLYATLITDSLVPTPDYVQYRDQASELDEITARISSLTKSLKVVGVYDKTCEGLENFLGEGLENKMVPVKNWAMHAEKGGLTKAVEWFPIDMVVKVIQGLYEVRAQVKEDLNEITGMADIVRGQSDPDETAAAQKIKGKFATLRLSEAQNEVRVFMQGTVKIMAEVIAKHFSQKTLALITGQKLMTKEEKLLWQISQAQQAPAIGQIAAPHPMTPPQQGQPSAPQQPPSPGMSTGMPSQTTAPASPPPAGANDPSWDEVMDLLHDQAALSFKIDIETDSTIKQEQDEERDAAVKFAEMVGEAIKGMEEIGNPALLPLMGEILMFTVRKFKNARSLENIFEETIKKLAEAPPKPPKPDPAQINAQTKITTTKMEIQADAQREAAKNQLEVGHAHAELANTQIKEQGENQRTQAELAMDQRLSKMEQDAETGRQFMKAQMDKILSHLGHTQNIHRDLLDQQKPLSPPPVAVIAPVNGASPR